MMNIIVKLIDTLEIKEAGTTYVYDTKDTDKDGIVEWRVVVDQVDEEKNVWGYCMEKRREANWDRYGVFLATVQDSREDYIKWRDTHVEFIKVDGTDIFKQKEEPVAVKMPDKV